MNMTKTFDTLYKRTKTGAIQYWIIAVRDALGSAQIKKESGQLGTTNPIVHVEAVHEGKNIGKANETTPAQQALLQAESDWKKKRDEGYKSLEDLNIKNPPVNPGEGGRYSWDRWLGSEAHGRMIPYYGTLPDVLDQALPQFNTDASGNIKPMLAPTKPWKAGDKKAKYPKQLETKFDGVRTLCILDNTLGTICFLSRSGKPYTMRHLEIAIVKNLDVFPAGITILDGEIYKHGWTLQEINRAVKKYRPGITEQLEFWMYDLPLHKGNQAQRNNQVVKYEAAINHPSIKVAFGTVVTSDEEVKEHHDRWVKDGYEGAILKDPFGTYQQGQRSSFWTKVKMFDENEYKIIGYELGQRGAEDLIFQCEIMVDGTMKTFGAKMKGSRESKEELYADIDNIIGKPLTVKHFGYTEYGIPFIPTGKAIRDYE